MLNINTSLVKRFNRIKIDHLLNLFLTMTKSNNQVAIVEAPTGAGKTYASEQLVQTTESSSSLPIHYFDLSNNLPVAVLSKLEGKSGCVLLDEPVSCVVLEQLVSELVFKGFFVVLLVQDYQELRNDKAAMALQYSTNLTCPYCEFEFIVTGLIDEKIEGKCENPKCVAVYTIPSIHSENRSIRFER